MTSLQQYKERDIRRFIISIVICSLLGGGFIIFQYTNLADSRFELSELKKELALLQSSNADLKNKLYELTDPARLEQFGREQGLVLERQPEYLTSTGQWLSDSSR